MRHIVRTFPLPDENGERKSAAQGVARGGGRPPHLTHGTQDRASKSFLLPTPPPPRGTITDRPPRRQLRFRTCCDPPIPDAAPPSRMWRRSLPSSASWLSSA